jgi:hypothetical protein
MYSVTEFIMYISVRVSPLKCTKLIQLYLVDRAGYTQCSRKTIFIAVVYSFNNTGMGPSLKQKLQLKRARKAVATQNKANKAIKYDRSIHSG